METVRSEWMYNLDEGILLLEGLFFHNRIRGLNQILNLLHSIKLENPIQVRTFESLLTNPAFRRNERIIKLLCVNILGEAVASPSKINKVEKQTALQIITGLCLLSIKTRVIIRDTNGLNIILKYCISHDPAISVVAFDCLLACILNSYQNQAKLIGDEGLESIMHFIDDPKEKEESRIAAVNFLAMFAGYLDDKKSDSPDEGPIADYTKIEKSKIQYELKKYISKGELKILVRCVNSTEAKNFLNRKSQF